MTDFRKSTVYQVYPKSFYDSNGDGIGDLRGVAAKLDYIADLGADYLWLTPFFVSPQRDNGYDVADYRAIDPRYGTAEDFEELAREADRRGIRLMLDMVFNHTSTEHPWFQKALAGDPEYRDYYIFRKGKPDGSPPTNWQSKFGGSAWEYVPALDQYYLHLFDPEQADLNWDNGSVRREAAEIVRFWMAKGVKAFRFDVVNLISKGMFEDDPDGDGRRFYTDGPRVHEFLKELNISSFGMDPEIVTVGEMSSTSMENCYQFAGENSHELSMIFSFHHLKVDFVGNDKWVLVPFDFMKLKQILFSWQAGMAEHSAWNAVFWCNHDQPRVVSRFGDEGRWRVESAKMLATALHCLRGTPYVYQGEELGMTNAGFTELSQYRDVESLNHYQILRDKGLSEQSACAVLAVHSRDNSRTPMQWNNEPQGGFTRGTPWIPVNGNYRLINAEEQRNDPHSVFSYYRKLISLRREYDVISQGDFCPVDADSRQILAYIRSRGEEQLLVVCNFYKKETEWECPLPVSSFKRLIGNYLQRELSAKLSLRPYEAVVFYSGRREEK